MQAPRKVEVVVVALAVGVVVGECSDGGRLVYKRTRRLFANG